MLRESTVSIGPSQQWASLTDPHEVITIEGTAGHRWVVSTTDGRDHELTAAAIRAQYRLHSLGT